MRECVGAQQSTLCFVNVCQKTQVVCKVGLQQRDNLCDEWGKGGASSLYNNTIINPLWRMAHNLIILKLFKIIFYILIIIYFGHKLSNLRG
jgi:hypothetical protein